MQKRGADEFACVSVCVSLGVCTCVSLRRRGLQRGSLKEDSEGMKHRSIGGPLRLSIFPHKHQTPPYHQSVTLRSHLKAIYRHSHHLLRNYCLRECRRGSFMMFLVYNVYVKNVHPCVCPLIQLLEVRMQYELNDIESPDGGGEQTSALPTPGASPQTSGPPSHPSTSSNNSDGGNIPCLKYETHTHTHI